MRVQAGYFYRDINQFIDWVRDSATAPYMPFNLGRNLVHGINAHISQQLVFGGDHRFGYFASYTFLKPSYQSTGFAQSKYVLEALQNQVIVGVNYGYKGFGIQVNGRFIERIKNKPYTLLDVRASYSIKGFTAYVDISNLLNAVYKEVGAVPMPPRWFSAGLKYTWEHK